MYDFNEFNLSGVAQQFATHFWAYPCYTMICSSFCINNSSFLQSRLLNCYKLISG